MIKFNSPTIAYDYRRMVIEYMLCGNRGLQLVDACEVEKAYACSYLCFAYVTYDTGQRPNICVNLLCM